MFLLAIGCDTQGCDHYIALEEEVFFRTSMRLPGELILSHGDRIKDELTVDARRKGWRIIDGSAKCPRCMSKVNHRDYKTLAPQA
jgi:hypothetical protein